MARGPDVFALFSGISCTPGPCMIPNPRRQPFPASHRGAAEACSCIPPRVNRGVNFEVVGGLHGECHHCFGGSGC